MDILDKIISAESSGNPDKANKPNKTSSALGLGQFINGTWLDMVKRYKPKLAEGKSDAEILELRKNSDISKEMTARYAEENQARLRRAGVPVTPTSTYLMHFAGPGGGVKLMKADPNTPVESILDDNAIKANAFLRGKTASWVIAWANKKMESAAASRPAAAPRRVPWDAGSQPIPSLLQTQAVEPAFGATSWPQRPASPNVLSPDAARRIAGAPRAAPIPFLDGTMRAQQALDNSLPAPGAAPWDLADRFGRWSSLGGVLGPASASYASLQGGYDKPSPPGASALAPNAPEETIVDAPAVRRSDIRWLTRRDVSNEADVSTSGAPPVPYLPYR
ncbi:hypothetical protein [Bradyrhizobium sp. I71]|uniref:lytic transglycosylase domain-containing protein n=1 Tax=Bradyrhizobium sp. I71 TaxID=2590772 RepID=UPI001EF9B63E|nr:hypothetical protein [Bradyrhizobium sp. I71]ULK99367.1 hypothetical protein FJV43_06380 [Bradyrhizobium sp. I71]